MAKKVETGTSVILCPKCGKAKPITVFNGDLVCPLCKASVMENVKVNLDDGKAASEFALSQAYFGYYLESVKKTLSGRKSIAAKHEAENGKKYLAKAIGLCRSAAMRGNPYAVVNLGYYVESGYDDTIIKRRDFVKWCYNLVATSKEAGIDDIREIARINLVALTNRKETETNLAPHEVIKELLAKSQDRLLDRTPFFGTVRLRKPQTDEEKSALIDQLIRAYKKWKVIYVLKDKEYVSVNPTVINNDIEETFCASEYAYLTFYNKNYKAKYGNKTLKSIRKDFDVKENEDYETQAVESASLITEKLKSRKDIDNIIFAENDLLKIEDVNDNGSVLDELLNLL